MSESLTELPRQSGTVPPRNRAGALIGAIAGATLLAAGLAACGGGSSPAKSSSGGTSTTGGAAAPTPATTPGPLTEPAQIATLQKAADQSVARDLLHQIQKTAKGAQVSAATYIDSTNKTHTVLVYGGTNLPVPAGSEAKQIKDMLGSGTAAGSGVKVGKASPVKPGAAGGMAKCAPLLNPNGTASRFVTCGWINGKSALVMSFGGFNAKSARSLVPQIITAMVKS